MVAPVTLIVAATAHLPETPRMQEAQLPKTAAPGAPTPMVGDEVAILQTSEGRIALAFFPDKAPNHVKNFKDLVRKGFYDGTRFHRVIPGFMVQGGDPNSRDLALSDRWGTGDPGYKIDAEFNDTKHTRGVLSMARSANPDSAGSQFFIMHKDAPHLDGQYSAFGIVVEGMDVVDKIVAKPTTGSNGSAVPATAAQIEKASIKNWPNYGE
jgi:cyclophilin family peptidyl-prolyl cis-trans isomerase